MRIRSICALAALLFFLTACNLQPQTGLPITQTDAARSLPAASSPGAEVTATGQPAPTLEPSLTPGPAQTATAFPTVTPAPISPDNAARLRPVAIYPYFRRGLLRSVQWSPDSASLVVETNLGLQILSVPDLQKRFSLPDTSELYFLNSGDLLIMEDGSPVRLNLATGKTSALPVQLPDGESGPVQYALSPSGKLWATWQNGELSADNLETGENVSIKILSKTLIAFNVEGLSFSTDSTRLYAYIRRVDNETELIAVDTTSWKQIYETFNADGRPQFSLDSAYMAYDRGDRIWIDRTKDGKNWSNLARKTIQKVSSIEQNILTAVGLSFIDQEGRIAVLYNNSVSNSRRQEDKFLPASVMIYNTATAKEERFINGLPANVVSFAVAPDGKTFFTASKDGIIRLWKLEDGALIKESQPYEMDSHPDVRSDGKLAAYALEDRVSLVDPASGQQKVTIGSYPGATHLQARFVGPDRLAIFVQTEWRRFIDTYQIEPVKFLFRYPDLGGCNFSAAGNLMICFEDVLKFFDMPTGQALLDLVPQGSGLEYAYSSDGNRVASCTRGGEFIYVWEIRVGSIPKYTLGGKSGSCGKLAFSGDGKKLASSSGYYWEVTTGKLLLTFTPAGDGLTVMSPTSDLLLVYPNLINLATGKGSGTLQAVPDIHSAAFQPDGLSLVLETRRGIEVWSVGP